MSLPVQSKAQPSTIIYQPPTAENWLDPEPGRTPAPRMGPVRFRGIHTIRNFANLSTKIFGFNHESTRRVFAGTEDLTTDYADPALEAGTDRVYKPGIELQNFACTYNGADRCRTGKKPEGRGNNRKAAEHCRTPRRKRKTKICIRGHPATAGECGGLTPLSESACNSHSVSELWLRRKSR